MFSLLEYRDDIKDNIVHIDVDIITLCNQKCPYCYVMRENYSKKILSKNELNIIIKKLKRYHHNIHLNILGGEPTLHPLLRYFADECSKLDNIRVIKIYSNGLKNVGFDNPKIRFAFTYHPSSCKDKSVFLETLLQHDNFDLTIMVPQDDDYLNDVDEMYKKFYKTHKVYINYPDYTYKNYMYIPLREDDLFLDEDKILSQYKIRDKQFIGRECWFNYLSININGNIENNCLEFGNIFRNDLPEPRFIVCKNSCDQICLKSLIKI